jgi:hypothetical protein
MHVSPRIPTLPNKSFFAMNRWFYKMYLAGLLYHPDDQAETIVSLSSGQPTFTPDECLELNRSVDLMFDHHGDNVYGVALHYFHKAMDIPPQFSKA